MTDLTQSYSTWGDKLLCHTNTLYNIAHSRHFSPITVQLAPCEVCESDCPFCSVSGRPLKSSMPFKVIMNTLKQFKELGAKSIEITGGGNPMLYKDGAYNINDIIALAHSHGYKIGIITNSHDLKMLQTSVYDMIDWIRISLIKLDEGYQPGEYNFRGFPEEKLGFSYIVHAQVDETPRTKRAARGTTSDSFLRMKQLVELHPKVKFVRLAGNCLIKGNNTRVRDSWQRTVDAIDPDGKFFFKDIGDNDSPYNDGCYVGMIRPYVAPDPHGDGYYVYTCTSHVLQTRTYDKAYAMCHVDNITKSWGMFNDAFKKYGYPYQVKNSEVRGWKNTCSHCYYANNNRLLHVVAHGLPDKDFA